jgi:hypothetical protein
VLAENSEESYLAPLLTVDDLKEKELLGLDHPDYENQSTYQINREFKKAPSVMEKTKSNNKDERNDIDNITRPVLGTFFKNILTEKISEKVASRENTRSL